MAAPILAIFRDGRLSEGTLTAALDGIGDVFAVEDVVSQMTLLTRLRDQAAYWGQLIGAEYGEPFAVREPLGLHSMQAVF